MAKKAKLNTTLSENLSLFQSLQVVADDETALAEPTSELANKKLTRNNSEADQICLRPLAIGALVGN